MRRYLTAFALLFSLSLLAQPVMAQQPDLIAVKTNDTGGMGTVNTPFTWSIQISNIGTGNYFINGAFDIIRDELPNTNMTYGTPSITSSSGITGVIACNINASFRLTCFDNSAVTITPGGTFTVSFTATPTAAGVFDNPRSGQICRADPGNENTESNEGNNDCSDSVVVTTGATGPDLTIIKNNNVSGVTELANGPFTWSLAVANGGDADATFSSGQTILTDNLPNTNISYAAPSVGSQTGISGTGTISCSIASSNLTCVASGGTVTLAAATGGFAVSTAATATAAATYVNPRAGGSCSVDPNGNISEGDEANNSCSDSVTVNGSPDLIGVKSNDTGGSGTVSTPFTWSIQVTNIGTANYFINGAFNILVDDLPNANMTYGTPSITSSSGITGVIACNINASSRLTCFDNSAVTITPGGTFTVSFTATPTTAATFDNPRSGGICRVNPGNEDQESDNTNNDCSDTVVVGTGITGPDLTIVKNNNVGGATELASGSFDWTLMAANGGDMEATFSSGQTIISDNLPNTDISYGTPVVSGQTGISGMGSINCSIASFNLTCSANGGSVTMASTSGAFTVTIPATPSAPGNFANPRAGGACTVDGNDVITEGDETNNSCSNTVVVAGSPDLIATKTNDTGGVATVGTPFDWSIQVTNIGTANYFINGAFNILVDDLPNANMTYGTPSITSSSGITGTIACSINASSRLACVDNSAVTITPGGTFTVGFTATPTSVGTFDNPRSGGICRANPGNADQETDTTNNDCSDTVSINTADIAVTVDDGVTSAVPGGSVTYTIVATNNGPGADPSVSLIDNFPASLSCNYTSSSAGGATGNTAAGSGDLAETLNMPSGSSVTYTAVCNIDSSATGTLSNTATVSGSISDPVAANNTDTDSDTVLNPETDISVSKTDGITAAVPGQTTVVYTIVVTNNGPSDDPNVGLNDVLPTDLSCTFSSMAAGGATGNTPVSGGNLSETLNMPAGSSVTYTVSCTIDASATGTLSNTATVSTSVTDTDSGNDSATDDDTQLTPEADLVITKVDDADPAVAGTNITYTVTVNNQGPSDASNVVVTDNLPAGLTLVSTSGCIEDPTGTPSCSLGDIPSGGNTSYTISADIDLLFAGVLSNTATVSANTTDPDTGNNSATEDTTVTAAESDLALLLTTTALPPVLLGDTFDVMLDVTNNGPDANTNVVVTTDLPNGLTFVSSGCATAIRNSVTFAAGNLAVAASASCVFTVEATFPGLQTISATANGDVGDPVTANNVDITSLVTVDALAIPIPTLSFWGLLVLVLGVLAMMRSQSRRRLHFFK